MEKQYSIALRKRNNLDRFWEYNDFEFVDYHIDCDNRYWLADPFLFEKDNVVYLFFEAYDLISLKGKIGYSIINNNNTASKPKIVIDEPFHLSFPHIFEFGDDVYIIPESCENNSIGLYRAVSFPDKWEKLHNVVDNIYSCDTILISNKNENYLLTSALYKEAPNGYNTSCWVRNELIEISNDFKQIQNPVLVSEGDYGIRNAGGIIEYLNHTYRVGQNCKDGVYGSGICFFEIKQIIPYKEVQLFEYDYSQFTDHIVNRIVDSIIGVHTYNSSKNYEVIDYSFRKKPSVLIRILRKINKAFLKDSNNR